MDEQEQEYYYALLEERECEIAAQENNENPYFDLK